MAFDSSVGGINYSIEISMENISFTYIGGCNMQQNPRYSSMLLISS